MTDKYLLSLWREAVLDKYYHRCAFCERYGDEFLQAHHIVRRRHKLTRYELINGIPLCTQCHALAHTKLGERKIMDLLGKEYDKLIDMELMTFKEFAVEKGITEKEYREQQGEKLKKYIGGVKC